MSDTAKLEDEVLRLRALIEHILSFSDFTAAQQEWFRREAGLK